MRLLLLGIGIFYGYTAGAYFDPRFAEGNWAFSGETRYFSTTENYDDSGGAFEALPGGNSFSNLDTEFDFRYDFTDRLSTFARMNISHSRSRDLNFERTNTGITHIGGGLRYLTGNRRFKFIPELSLLYPITRIDPNADKVLISDGTLHMNGRAMAVWDLGDLELRPVLGFIYRDEGRPTLMEYELQLVAPLKDFTLGGGLLGYSTLIDDDYTQTPTNRTTITNRVNGGSYKFYEVNPSELQFNAWGGLQLTEYLTGRLGLTGPITGSNAAKGFTLIVGFSYSSIEEIDEQSVRVFKRKIKKKRHKRSQRIKKFKYKTEEADDDRLFDDRPRRKKKKTKQLLDETEDLLER